MKGRRDGFTLSEMVVSGAVLIIASMMMVQVLTVSGGLLMKSERLNRQQESLEWNVLKGVEPSRSESVSVDVSGYGSWDVVIDTYDSTPQKNKGSIHFKTVRNGADER